MSRDHVYQVFDFSLTVAGGVPVTQTFPIAGISPGIDFNYAEMGIIVSGKTGSGTNAALDAVLQGSLDGFTTSALTETIISLSQDAAGATNDAAQKEASTPTMFGKDMRISLTAAADDDVVYTGKLIVAISNI